MKVLVSLQAARNAALTCTLHVPLMVRVVSMRDAQANFDEPLLAMGLADLGFAMV